ncbi:hypothetical protein AOR13_3703 [Alteromonas stellipolaris LMG 21856]|nr:hypothetical protein AOR13_3703 [Alteromonas stellipolaris LMG 21856]
MRRTCQLARLKAQKTKRKIIGKQLGAYTGISQYNLLAHNASLALT